MQADNPKPRKNRMAGIGIKRGLYNVSRAAPDGGDDDDDNSETVVQPSAKRLHRKPKPLHMGDLDNNEIETPEDILHELEAEFGKMFDPCPYVGRGLKPDFNGLEIPWQEINYINPPYNDILPWFTKAINEWEENGHVSVFLVPARPGTRYWQHNVYAKARELRFISGKVIFKGYATPPPHNLAVIVFGDRYANLPSTAATTVLNHIALLNGKLRSQAMKNLLAVLEGAAPAVELSASGRPTLAVLKPDALRWEQQFFCSAKEFLSNYDAGTLDPTVQNIVFPFFCRLLELELQHKTETISIPPLNVLAEFSLPELLRRMASLLKSDPAFLHNCTKQDGAFSSKPLSAEECRVIQSFYEAYSLNLHRHHYNQHRIPYQKPSYDRKLEQQALFL